MKRAAFSLSLLLTTAALGADFATATKHLHEKPQWAPTAPSATTAHARSTRFGSPRASSGISLSAREIAVGQTIWLSPDSVGASSFTTRPNGLGPWSCAAGNPKRFTDSDGRSEQDIRCVAEDRAGCDIFGVGRMGGFAMQVCDARRRYQLTRAMRDYSTWSGLSDQLDSILLARQRRGALGPLEAGGAGAGVFLLGGGAAAVAIIGAGASGVSQSAGMVDDVVAERPVRDTDYSSMAEGSSTALTLSPLVALPAFVQGALAILGFHGGVHEAQYHFANNDSVSGLATLFMSGLGAFAARNQIAETAGTLTRALPTRLNPANYDVGTRLLLATGPVPPIPVPTLQFRTRTTQLQQRLKSFLSEQIAPEFDGEPFEFFVHGTTSSGSRSFKLNRSFRLFTTPSASTAEIFALRTVGREGGTVGGTVLALPRSEVARLRQLGLVRTQYVPDMPNLLETIFEPGAFDTIEKHGIFEPLSTDFFAP